MLHEANESRLEEETSERISNSCISSAMANATAKELSSLESLERTNKTLTKYIHRSDNYHKRIEEATNLIQNCLGLKVHERHHHLDNTKVLLINNERKNTSKLKL